MNETDWLARTCIPAAYLFLAGSAAALIKSFAARSDLLREFMAHTRGGGPAASRYSLLLVNTILAVLFLFSVLAERPFRLESDLMKLLDPDLVAGASGMAYLLAKIGRARVIALFNKRRADQQSMLH